MNNNLKKLTNQANSKEISLKNKKWQKPRIFLPGNKSLNDIADSLASFSPKHRELFNLLVWYCDSFKTVYVSQSRLAEHAQCSLRTVVRFISRCIELGYLDTMYRHMTTSLYRLSPVFYNPHVRMALKDIIPSFKNMALLMLLLISYNQVAATCKPASNRGIQNRVLQAPNVFSLFINSLENNYNRNTSDHSGMRNRGSFFDLKNVEYGKTTAKRELVMQTGYSSDLAVMSEYVKNIRCMELTAVGQAALMKFPLEAINYAQDRLFNYQWQIDNPFKLFCKIATNYCEGKRLPVNYQVSSTIKTMLKLEDDAVTHVVLGKEEFNRRKAAWNLSTAKVAEGNRSVARVAEGNMARTANASLAPEFPSRRFEGTLHDAQRVNTPSRGKSFQRGSEHRPSPTRKPAEPRICTDQEYARRVSEQARARNPHAISIDEIRRANPTMAWLDGYYSAPRVVTVVHHNDTEWRDTTQEERDIWTANMQANLNPDGRAFLQAMGLPLPSAPLTFKGNCNVPHKAEYHVALDGTLHCTQKERDAVDLALPLPYGDVQLSDNDNPYK